MVDTENRSVDASDRIPPHAITIFLCGDVMTGRGIDQILPHPSDPTIYESYMKSAQGYVKIAERVNGPIQKPVEFAYIWGDALAELDRSAPHVRLINLETSITTHNDYWESKGIHYRMNPQNITSLTAAGIDVCALANNHVLDWGHAGLQETLDSLRGSGLQTAGAGMDETAASAPAQDDPVDEDPADDPGYDLPDGARTIVGSPDPGPKPEDAGDRGGWAQLLLLGVMAGGVGVVAWRISRAVRAGPTPPTAT